MLREKTKNSPENYITPYMGSVPGGSWLSCLIQYKQYITSTGNGPLEMLNTTCRNNWRIKFPKFSVTNFRCYPHLLFSCSVLSSFFSAISVMLIILIGKN